MRDQDAAPFVAAIADAPGDDLPRLIYADWLDEHAGAVACRGCDGTGQTGHGGVRFGAKDCPACRGTGRVSDGRAEHARLIRAQCRLAALERGAWEPAGDTKEELDAKWAARCREIDELRHVQGRELAFLGGWYWSLPPCLNWADHRQAGWAAGLVHRGFVQWVRLPAAELPRVGGQLLAAQPVERFECPSAGGWPALAVRVVPVASVKAGAKARRLGMRPPVVRPVNYDVRLSYRSGGQDYAAGWSAPSRGALVATFHDRCAAAMREIRPADDNNPPRLGDVVGACCGRSQVAGMACMECGAVVPAQGLHGATVRSVHLGPEGGAAYVEQLRLALQAGLLTARQARELCDVYERQRVYERTGLRPPFGRGAVTWEAFDAWRRLSERLNLPPASGPLRDTGALRDSLPRVPPPGPRGVWHG
jgi:uncharacterized protein (TIGR02996 family)